MPDTVRAAVTKKLLDTERRLYLNLGLADVNGRIKDIPKVDMTAMFDTYLGDPGRHAIEHVLSAIRTGDFELQQTVRERVDTLVNRRAMWMGKMPKSGRNLWEFAMKELSVQEIECVNSNFKSDLNIGALLVELQQVAIDSRTQSEAGRWMIERANKTPIVLRDKFDQTATWVGKFIKIIDSAVQYDPGHAALPWAGVKLILQVVHKVPCLNLIGQC